MILSILSAAGLAAMPAVAAPRQIAIEQEIAPRLSLFFHPESDATTFFAKAEGIPGPGFLLVGHACSTAEEFDLAKALPLGVHLKAQGDTLEFASLDSAWLMGVDPFVMHLAALAVAPDGSVVLTEPKPLFVGAVPCERLTFNFAADGESLVAGEQVTEQWAEIGIHVSAQNKVGGHPDKVIVFDSSNPTGGDFDLQTPGYGPGNDTALGNLMIIAEDDVDADGDGLVDDPDDEEGGGVITFEFDDPVTFCAIQLVDLDDGGLSSVIRFYDADGVLFDSLGLTPAGDNSVTTVGGTFLEVSRLEIDFTSSGGIATMEFVFCPTRVNFDRSTSGVPLELSAGEPISEQFAQLGMHVSAVSFGGFDQAILFDTDNPTGGDFDLGAADEGLVLILAENMTDADGDGLVDDPDDEVQGGVLIIDFDTPTHWRSATVLDIDADEVSYFEAYDGAGALLATVPLQPLGDGSTQTVTPMIEGVARLELHLDSSGALAGLEVCPDILQGTPPEG